MPSVAHHQQHAQSDDTVDQSDAVFRLGDRRPPAAPVLTVHALNVVRVSLAWLDASGHPIAMRTPSGAQTLVVVWPTSIRGRVDTRRLLEAHVAEWRLTELDLRRVEEIHSDFPLRDHDLLVRGNGVSPCATSLLHAPSEVRELRCMRQRLRAEIRRRQEHLQPPPRHQ